MNKNKKVTLITGGAGFIGSHLAEKLLQLGEEIFVIDDLSTGSVENISHLKKNKKFHFVEGSVTDLKKVKKLVKRVSQIYHLAGAVGVKTVMEKPLDSFLKNIKGSKIVFDLAQRYKKKVLFTSSSEVYGKNDKFPFKENSPRVYGSAFSSRWGYGISKAADEFLGLAYFREKNLPIIIVRLFNVIGPRQSSAYGMVVPTFIHQALSGKDITVHGDGSQSRCFADIEDVTRALIQLMAKPEAVGQIFNLGSNEEIKIRDLAQKIKFLTKTNSKIKFIPYTQAYPSGFEDMFRRKPDLSKIKNIIGYAPKIRLKESLQKIIDYYTRKK